MTTTNPRLNITLSDSDMEIITLLAKKEKKSMSAIARDLIQEALELQEDLHFSALAMKRDIPGAKTVKLEDVNWD